MDNNNGVPYKAQSWSWVQLSSDIALVKKHTNLYCGKAVCISAIYLYDIPDSCYRYLFWRTTILFLLSRSNIVQQILKQIMVWNDGEKKCNFCITTFIFHNLSDLPKQQAVCNSFRWPYPIRSLLIPYCFLAELLEYMDGVNLIVADDILNATSEITHLFTDCKNVT